MTSSKDKSIMRNLGEFFGHIIKGVKTDPRNPPDPRNPANPSQANKRTEVSREVEEEDRGDMILRRTTIEEIEFKSDSSEDKNEH